MLAAASLAMVAGPLHAARLGDASDLAALAADAGIIVLGEVHDNPAHHVFQADAVAAIGASALVFEMLTAGEAQRITPELASDPAALEDALNWSESGWPDFAMYYPLLAYGARIPILGAEVPRDVAREAFASGAAGVFGSDPGRFGLTDPLDPAEQRLREAEQQDAHCNALPEDILPGFVEAQRLRDASLAEAALAALGEHGPPVVVITGNGHARTDWGVPAIVSRAAPEVAVFALGQFETEPAGPVPFDAWTVADPVARPDPCAAFR